MTYQDNGYQGSTIDLNSIYLPKILFAISSGVKPKCLAKTPAGALNPNVSIPMTRLAYLYHPCEHPISIAVVLHLQGRILALYSSLCTSYKNSLGIDTTFTLKPRVSINFAASSAYATS